MADAFVQAGIGEVPLSAVLALKEKAFWTRTEQEIAADVHEERHPGVTVRRPWESAAQHAERAKKRPASNAPKPTLGMARERAEPELARQRLMLAGLTPDHPQYEPLFASLTTEIWQLEEILGLPLTKYVKGVIPKRKEDSVAPELAEKLKKYVDAKEGIRRASIQAGTDLELLALIRDHEALPELQVLAVQRIEQVKAVQ